MNLTKDRTCDCPVPATKSRSGPVPATKSQRGRFLYSTQVLPAPEMRGQVTGNLRGRIQ